MNRNPYENEDWDDEGESDSDIPEGMSQCEMCGEIVHNDQGVTADEWNLGGYIFVCWGCMKRDPKTVSYE